MNYTTTISFGARIYYIPINIPRSTMARALVRIHRITSFCHLFAYCTREHLAERSYDRWALSLGTLKKKRKQRQKNKEKRKKRKTKRKYNKIKIKNEGETYNVRTRTRMHFTQAFSSLFVSSSVNFVK